MKKEEALNILNGLKIDAQHWQKVFSIQEDFNGADLHKCIASAYDRAIEIVEEII
jgi:hypothetical protein